MKNTLLLASAMLLLFCTSCKKESLAENLSTSGFTQYVIPKGQHYATQNAVKSIETTELKFVVKFDSSAIYQTVDPQNQYDINKLYGFSDNGESHHRFSARIGWRWSEGALRLFGYTYNNGVRAEKEISTIAIGSEVVCAIKVLGESYQFTVNGKTELMPRASAMPVAKGYQLYPYFGGDEVAPHEVRIWIRLN
ncbi:MAG TPA: hypothetical protein VMR70_15225 [Flavisolibacter sp.]|nr:hypothetical protein [Flavisolibacter sp.]